MCVFFSVVWNTFKTESPWAIRSGNRRIGPVEEPSATFCFRRLSHLRILVVDDDAGICELIRIMLARQGHTVQKCESAESALAVLASGSRFNVMLTDLTMPGMSGIELIKSAVNRKLVPSKQVVAMTGGEEKNHSVRWLSDNDIPILRKPFNSTTIRQILETIPIPDTDDPK